MCVLNAASTKWILEKGIKHESQILYSIVSIGISYIHVYIHNYLSYIVSSNRNRLINNMIRIQTTHICNTIHYVRKHSSHPLWMWIPTTCIAWRYTFLPNLEQWIVCIPLSWECNVGHMASGVEGTSTNANNSSSIPYSARFTEWKSSYVEEWTLSLASEDLPLYCIQLFRCHVMFTREREWSFQLSTNSLRHWFNFGRTAKWTQNRSMSLRGSRTASYSKEYNIV